jgi:hypothetical protein
MHDLSDPIIQKLAHARVWMLFNKHPAADKAPHMVMKVTDETETARFFNIGLRVNRAFVEKMTREEVVDLVAKASEHMYDGNSTYEWIDGDFQKANWK